MRQAVLETLADPEVVLGAFSFALDGAGATPRLFERGANLRARSLGMPYGDHGFFMRPAALRALGGFPEIAVLEDYELSRRARRAGRVTISPSRLVTSDRGWRSIGPWRRAALDVATILRYRLGASPEVLAAWRTAVS
jgi:hypothetical protein